MTVVKITVLKRCLNADLVEKLSDSLVKPCDVFEEGQEFIGGLNMPEGFCAWAWSDISKMVVSLMAGAQFDRGLFNNWMKSDNTAIACCTDGFRPVIFKLERIDTNDLVDEKSAERPAPREVYTSERWGECVYTFPGLRPGAVHRVRLHFCEIYHQTAGKRRFDVYAGADKLLGDFDIVAAAGAPYKAIVKEMDVAADSRGCLSLRFVRGAADQPKISAIEILDGPASERPRYAVNCGGGAQGTFTADEFFEGGNAAGS
jgi:uncharacterized repeat protein (TIGR04076 family)